MDLFVNCNILIRMSNIFHRLFIYYNNKHSNQCLVKNLIQIYLELKINKIFKVHNNNKAQIYFLISNLTCLTNKMTKIK